MLALVTRKLSCISWMFIVYRRYWSRSRVGMEYGHHLKVYQHKQQKLPGGAAFESKL
jgi:hypothetical protein